MTASLETRLPTPATSPGNGRQLLLIVWPLLAAVVLILCLAIASLQLLGASNAYVGGESLWSKQQKDAVLHLEHYAENRDEGDYQAFLTDMQLVRSDERARQELDRADFNSDQAARSLMDGGANSADVPGLVWLYRWCKSIPGMNAAIAVWASADAQVDLLLGQAAALHQAVRQGRDDAAVHTLLTQVWQTNMQLGSTERRFSEAIQAAARWMKDMLVGLLCVAGALFIFAGVFLSRRMLGSIRRYEVELLSRQRRLLDTEQLAHVGSWTWTPAINHAEYSAETGRLLGLTGDMRAPFPEQYLAGIHPADRPRMTRLWDEAVEHGRSHQAEYRTLLGGQEPRWISEFVHTQVDATGKIASISGTIMDITAHKQAEEHIRQLAHYDNMTGLPNRSLMYQRLQEMLTDAGARQQRLALLFIDFDGIRAINDTLGHDVGDVVLKIAAKRLRECGGDAGFLARLGSDDFALIHGSFADPSDVVTVARMIHYALNLPISVHNHDCRLSTTIGISIFPDDGHDVQTLCRNASLAMERASEKGRNRYEFYSAEMGHRSLRRLALESALHSALQREELLLHYQPRIDLADGSVLGFEALVRWQHPDEGLLQPGEFISLAEETGLIVPVGSWVLRAACQQARVWRKQTGRDFRMAVNLSARQFDDEQLVDTVRSILAENDLDPDQLELEVTESMVMARPDHCISVLHELKALGIHLSIDDFGTGHSSLAYLKRLPVDSLKIDRAFVADLPDDAEAIAIARAVIALAHSLQLRVVAEGVETEAQASFLREQGCDEIQGYLFSRPLPAAAAEAFLEPASASYHPA